LETIETAFQEYGRAIDGEIAECLEPASDGSGGFYDMMRYQLGFVDEGRLRIPLVAETRVGSLLCVLTCGAVGGSWEEAVRAAAAIEFCSHWFQTHSHIEEQRATVCGRPTLWNLWGEAQAINTGDGMFALAARVTLRASSDPDVSLDLARRLTDAAVDLMEGQHMKLALGSREDVSPSKYTHAMEQKLAALMGYSAAAGATIGGAAEEVRQELRRFGRELEMGRQSRDEMTTPSRDTCRRKTAPAVQPEERARERLDKVLAALHRAHLGIRGEKQLTQFARQFMLGASGL